MVLPVGIRLNSPKNSNINNNYNSNNSNEKVVYTVGKLFSKGEFGAVHEVICTRNDSIDNTSPRWVVKLTPVPTKATKKQTSMLEVAHRLLWVENLLYSHHFVQYCGTALPKIPGKHEKMHGLDLFMDNIQGYRCLVMERMDAQLYDELPNLVEQCMPPSGGANGSNIDVGSIAIKLIQITEMFHCQQHLIIDVKPENIMTCHSNSSSVTKSTMKKKIVNNFSDTIRILDLGLVKCYLGPSGHKPNDGIQEVVGTPQYASLNVHNLQTPSRRDDVEAMLYVIGEIVIRIRAIIDGTVHTYEKKKGTTIPTYLPWSIASSDTEVGEMKERNMSDIKSEFYRRMPKDAAKIVMQCWEEVRSYNYSQKPRYDFLYDLLRDLTISVPPPLKKQYNATTTRGKVNSVDPYIDSSKTVERMTRSRSKGPSGGAYDNVDTKVAQQGGSNRRSNRKSSECPSDEGTPNKYRKVAFNSSKRVVEDVDSDEDDDELMDIDEQENDYSFHTAPSIADSFHSTIMNHDEMMIDPEDDYYHKHHYRHENHAHAPYSSIYFGQSGVKLRLTMSDKTTSDFFLVKNQNETIVFGSGSRAHTSSELVSVQDPKLLPSHVQISFKSERTVSISDLSHGKTFVMGLKVPKSGTTVFVGQGLKFGDATVEVLAVADKDYDRMYHHPESEIENSVLHKNNASTSRRRSPRAMPIADANYTSTGPPPLGTPKKTNSVKSKNPRVTIKVAGIGDWILEEGVCTSYVIGSNPISSTKVVKKLILPKSTGVQPNHARLDLEITKGVVMINVTDLKSGADTIVAGRKVPIGKSIMAFRGSQIQLGNVAIEI